MPAFMSSVSYNSLGLIESFFKFLQPRSGCEMIICLFPMRNLDHHNFFVTFRQPVLFISFISCTEKRSLLSPLRRNFFVIFWFYKNYLFRVEDLHLFNADPDSAYHFNAEIDAILRPFVYRPSRAPFCASKAPEFCGSGSSFVLSYPVRIRNLKFFPSGNFSLLGL